MKSLAIDAHSAAVNFVCFSPDGESVFCGGKDGDLKEWSTDGWSLVREYPGHTKQVNGVVFSPRGDIIVSAGSDGDVRWWNRSSVGDDDACFRTLKEARRSVDSLFVTPDGKYVLAGTLSEILLVISMADGSIERKVRPPVKRVSALDLSRLGTRLAVGGAGETVYLYSIPDASLVTSVKTGSQSVKAFVFCRDTRRALSFGSDNVLRVWDSADWHETTSMSLDGGEPGHLAVSPNGALAAVTSGNELALIELHEMEILQTIELPQGSGCLAFSPDEKLLAAASSDGLIHVWELT